MTTIDVVLRSYPVTTQTFHYQRLAELVKVGALGTVWVESKADGHVDPGLEALFGERVRFIGDLPTPSATTVARNSSLLIEASTKAMPGNGEGGSAGAVKQTLSGLRLGQHLQSHGGPDILHAAFCTANLTIARAAAIVADVPYSTEVHSPLSWSRNPGWFQAKVADASVVAVISDYTRKRVITHCPETRDNIVEVHCGLAPRPLEYANVESGDDLLTSVGGLVDKKGHDTFVAACARLGQRGQVVGGGELEAELSQLIKELDAPVEIVGELPHAEVLQRIASSHVGVLAARHGSAGDEDGVPVVLLEFMRAGVPVVSTPVAGIPALLRTTGSLAVADDAVALAGALRDPEISVRARAKTTIDSSYNSERETTTLVASLAAVGRPATVSR